MDADGFLHRATSYYAQAERTALSPGRFAETAEAIRRELRAATADLVPCACARMRADRQLVGQRHFDFAPPTPQRGPTPAAEGRAQTCAAKPD